MEKYMKPKWIVNDLGELGVEVCGRCFFLYKGDNIEYESGKHDDGTTILYRPVGKREFGETCKPDAYYSKGYHKKDRYTEPLVFHPRLSFGKPEDGNWHELPTSNKAIHSDGDGMAVLEGVEYIVNQVDAKTISLTRRR
jgi:hypothetical protein